MPRKKKGQKIRVYYYTKKDISAIGGLIAPDEEFRPVPGESALWVSNYGRLLSKRQKNPHLLNPVFQRGYRRVTLPQSVNGKYIKRSYYLHVLVAKCFCEIPEWIKPGDRIEVHHINAVDRIKDIEEINYASNLMFVPRKLHKAIDTIKEIAVKKGRNWVVMDFVSAADYYDLSPYEFVGAMSSEKFQKPTAKRGKYQYYKKEVGEKPVQINVRLVRLSAVSQ